MSAFADRPCPDWFAKPQLGIFIHWGLFTIPAFAPPGRSLPDLMANDFDRACVLSPYSEWYENAVRVAGSQSQAHHAAHWGNRPYTDFRPMFEAAAAAFDANAWADLFQRAGAEYVVMVTKHHDGYCLWPSAIPNPWRKDWASERDFVGELAVAVRARGMRFGLYYSGGLDWTARPAPIANLGEMFACVPIEADYRTYANAQVRELIDRYKPSVLWNDIAWPHADDVEQIFAYYYAVVPDGVVNDRWLGATALFESLRDPAQCQSFNAMIKARIAAGDKLESTPAHHCDFRTIEYGLGSARPGEKWEVCRGFSLGFGYNAAEPDTDYLTPDEFLKLHDDVIRDGGNLLINVGPKADASIPTPQLRCLEAIAARRSRA